jgi:transcriptional regulator GlxA family with amidase domain
MTKKRRILFIVYNQFAHLDMAGPSTVFATADTYADHAAYEIKYLSIEGGIIPSRGGPQIVTDPIRSIRPGNHDTILVVGAEFGPIKIATTDQRLLDWLRNNASKAERVGSICSGGFILAAAGLFHNKTVTSHWAGAQELQKRHPECDVNAEALYIEDNGLWTSAGVTTGIDMALEILKRDHDATLMGQVAKLLVVYSHRPGTQSQFSDILKAQIAATDPFYKIMSWALEHLDQPIKVSDLADKAAMSERTFYRKFTKQIGQTPSKFLEGARLEKAKSLLEANTPIKTTAAQTGFQTEAGFRAAFETRFGITPSHHRRMHAN